MNAAQPFPDSSHATAFLTGATGFVGSHIASALVGAGYRLRYSARSTSDHRWLRSLAAQPVTLDLSQPDSDGETLDAALSGASVLVHVAGLTRAPDERTFMRVNAEGTERLALAALRCGVKRFVLISSLAARGPDRRSISETELSDAPVSPYGRSKLEGENRLRAVAEGAGGLEYVILRPGGIYGPRDRDLLPMFRMARLGVFTVPTGGGRLQPVFVSDVARAACLAAGGSGPGGTFPLAEPFVYTWPELGQALAEAVNRKVRRVPVLPAFVEALGTLAEVGARLAGEPSKFDKRRATDLARLQWTCDPKVAEQGLGWIAEVPLAEGISKTADWYREVGWLKP